MGKWPPSSSHNHTVSQKIINFLLTVCNDRLSIYSIIIIIVTSHYSDLSSPEHMGEWLVPSHNHAVCQKIISFLLTVYWTVNASTDYSIQVALIASHYSDLSSLEHMMFCFPAICPAQIADCPKKSLLVPGLVINGRGKQLRLCKTHSDVTWCQPGGHVPCCSCVPLLAPRNKWSRPNYIGRYFQISVQTIRINFQYFFFVAMTSLWSCILWSSALVRSKWTWGRVQHFVGLEAPPISSIRSSLLFPGQRKRTEKRPHYR